MTCCIFLISNYTHIASFEYAEARQVLGSFQAPRPSRSKGLAPNLGKSGYILTQSSRQSIIKANNGRHRRASCQHRRLRFFLTTSTRYWLAQKLRRTSHFSNREVRSHSGRLISPRLDPLSSRQEADKPDFGSVTFSTNTYSYLW